MFPRRLVLALVLSVAVVTAGVGAAGGVATPTTPTAANASTQPLGHSISAFMQSNAAQTAGTVENGMWVAAYANASNESAKRALVEGRVGELNDTLAELKAERRALQAAWRNGTINRTTYLARLSTIVGRLAAFHAGVEEAETRGMAAGVNRTRLDVLRSQARNLTGRAVSRVARNLTGNRGPPGPPGLFDDDPPGRSAERGPPNATNRSRGGPGDAGNASDAGGPADGQGNASDDDGAGNQAGSDNAGGQGPPSGNGNDRGQSGGQPTATPTETASDG